MSYNEFHGILGLRSHLRNKTKDTSDLCRYRHTVWCTNIHAGKTVVHIK